jgi:septum formation protein
MNPIVPARLQEGLVLASASPRRAEILSMLGFDFEVEPVHVEESHDGRATAPEHARRLARDKACALRPRRRQGTAIGADTIVVLDDEIMGKPSSFEDALGMLLRLQGRWHTVHTGIALHDLAEGRGVDAVESTEVCFHACGDDTLRRYVETGECDDKAGAYAIQGVGAMLVKEIRGCYYNVMGFPIGSFLNLLRELRTSEVGRAG